MLIVIYSVICNYIEEARGKHLIQNDKKKRNAVPERGSLKKNSQ
jgi:hypothetical protein